MLWTKVSGNVVRIGCYVQGLYSKKMHVVAMRKGFKVIDFLWINFGCYLQGF
jgi:nucleoside-triphosphatase THEP1